MNSNEFIVRDAYRKRERDLKDSLKRDLVSYISEILTNADDSYRRLENSKMLPRETIKEILIEIKEDPRNKEGFVVSITDQAEGMSEENLRSKFKEYGADKADGELHTRGLFGQGASDVLFNAASEKRTAKIETIKDEVFTKATFNFDLNSNDSKIVQIDSIDQSANKLKNLRDSLKIFKNGTKVTFGVPSKVTYNPKTIVKEIEGYPYFKFILNDPTRKILFRQSGDLVETKLSSTNYQILGNPRFVKDFELSYKAHKLNCKLQLWKMDKSIINHDILVIDQHEVVYDNQFFGFDTQPKAKNLGGFLIINDFYKVLREELNSSEPVAVITANRKGFDVSQDFYKQLKEKVVSLINSKLDEIGEDVEEIDISSNKTISEVLKKLNRFFLNAMPEEIPYSGKEKGLYPPENGLSFSREKISLTVSKKYFIELLINSKQVDDTETIHLESEDPNVIEVGQKQISFSDSEKNPFGLVKKSFLIEAKSYSDNPVKIIAKSSKASCELVITTIEYEIHYPKDGIEFFPSRIRHKEKRNHNAKLYVDKETFNEGDLIFIQPSSDFVQILKTSLMINDTDFDSNGIAIYDVDFEGGKIGDTYKIKATINQTSTELIVEIRDKSKKENEGLLGLISSIKFISDKENKFEQAKFSKTDKVLTINRLNPINKAIWPNINALTDYEKISPKQITHLLDLISYHGAVQVYEYRTKKGEIEFTKQDFNQMVSRIYEIKTEIFELLKIIK
jgi:hypothetical protein